MDLKQVSPLPPAARLFVYFLRHCRQQENMVSVALVWLCVFDLRACSCFASSLVQSLSRTMNSLLTPTFPPTITGPRSYEDGEEGITPNRGELLQPTHAGLRNQQASRR